MTDIASYARYSASGVTSTFGVPFAYLDKTHVKVYRAGVLLTVTTDYTWLSASSVQLVAGNPAAGTVVFVQRVTPTTPLTVFTPGNLDSGDLNTGILQPLFVAQEARELLAAAALFDISGLPYVILGDGQSNAILTQVYNWSPPANLFVWNYRYTMYGVSFGTAFAACPITEVNAFMVEAAEYAREHPDRPVYLIMAGIPGINIKNWLPAPPSFDAYGLAKAVTEAALLNIGVVQIDKRLWWQGETQAGDGPAAYPADFETMETRYHTNSWYPAGTPLVIFGVSPYYAPTINSYLVECAKADPNTRTYVHPNSLLLTAPRFPDTLHADGLGCLYYGKLAYLAVQSGLSRYAMAEISVDPQTGRVGIGTRPSLVDDKLRVQRDTINGISAIRNLNLNVGNAASAWLVANSDAHIAGFYANSAAAAVASGIAAGMTSTATGLFMASYGGAMSMGFGGGGVVGWSTTGAYTHASGQAFTLGADPTLALQAATKQYVDQVAQGLDAKASVKVATTANITLSGEQTLDGVLTSGNRVLVKSQTLPQNNGIYVSAAGAWARAADMDSWAEVPGAFVFVEEGTTFGNTGWTCTSDVTSGVLGTTAITWAQFSGAGSFIADGSTLQLVGVTFSIKNVEVLALAGNATSGFWARTGAGTGAARTLQAGAGIGITNPAGTAGDPTIRNVRNRATQVNAALATFNTPIPLDDTPPLISEGTQILTAAITPLSATSLVKVSGKASFGAAAGAADYVVVSVYRGSTLIDCSVQNIPAINTFVTIPWELEDNPATTSATTYTVRAGGNAGSISLNGANSTRFYGGSLKAVLHLEELPQ